MEMDEDRKEGHGGRKEGRKAGKGMTNDVGDIANTDVDDDGNDGIGNYNNNPIWGQSTTTTFRVGEGRSGGRDGRKVGRTRREDERGRREGREIGRVCEEGNTLG
jgi:hypothetical protein